MKLNLSSLRTKFQNKVYMPLRTLTLFISVFICFSTFGDSRTCPSSGNWGYNHNIWSGGQVVRVVNRIASDTTITLTGDISLRHSVFIGDSNADADKGTGIGKVVIENGTDHQVMIWDDLDNPGDGWAADNAMVMFSVWEGSSLTIKGKPNAPIIIDANTTYRNLITKWGLLESTGRLILENVIIQNVKFDSKNAATGDCAVLKLHPWYSIENKYYYYMGKTTLRNVEIRNIQMDGGAGAAINCYLKTQGSEKNTRENCTVELYNVKIHNVKQTGHGVDGNGGIIRFRGDWAGDLIMKDCEIYDNESTYSCAGVYWNSMGWQNDPCKLTINGCTFRNNKVTGGSQNAGALLVEGNVEFVGNTTTFEGNSCTNYGGAVMIHNYNSTDEVASNHFDYSINDKVVFKNNKAAHGGGLCIRIDDSSTLAQGTTFNVSIDGAKFEGNEAVLEGGGLKVDRSTSSKNYPLNTYLNSGSFINNKAIGDGNGTVGNGGAIFSWSADIDCKDLTNQVIFYGNTANASGGGIYANGGTFKLSNVIFTNGTATNHDASAVYIQGGCKMTMESGTMTGGKALNGWGGAIHLKGASTLDIKQCNISNNQAGNKGGAIYIGEGSKLTIYNGEIIGNTAAQKGGGVFIDGTKDNPCSFTMNNGKINNNTATKFYGGGVNILCSNFTMNGGEINGNKAGSYGGGIFFDNMGTDDGGSNPKTFIFQNGSISNNVSGSHGGGLCLYGGNGGTDVQPQTFYLKKGIISGNTAVDGGGIYMNGWNKCILDMENTTVENNTAYIGAGMLFHYSILKYNNGLIRYNKAISRDGKSAPSTMYRQRHLNDAIKAEGDYEYLKNDQPNENINGIAGGLFLGDHARSTFSGNSFGIYGNYAEYGGDDIVSIGAADNGTVQVTLPDVSSMTLNDFKVGVPQAALFWAQDYIKNDTGYGNKPSNATATSTVERYRTLLAARTENIASIPSGVAYGNNQYVSVALGYKYIYVDVKKSGLKEGESAIFNIYSTKDVTASSTPYMQIVLTGNAAGSEVSRKIALTPGDWTVMETGWSWTYTGTSASNETVLGNPAIKRTIRDNPSNAERIFSFTNTKNTSVPNAEKVKVNDNMKEEVIGLKDESDRSDRSEESDSVRY